MGHHIPASGVHATIILNGFDPADPDPECRAFYEQCLAACGVDRSDVVEVPVRDDMIEVDVIDFDDPNWPRRTLSRRW